MTVTAAPSVLPAGTREYVPLGPYTTLGIGGPARYFVEAASETAVREALAFADARGLPVLLLGEGSNCLSLTEAFLAWCCASAITGIGTRPCPDGKVIVTAGAGENWDRFVAFCVERNLAGVEC
jgi:UDP-N-acetylmuramate dehydrogenase